VPGDIEENYLDYGILENKKFFHKVTKPFNETCYDLTPRCLNRFIKGLVGRAYESGCTAVLSIPVDVDDPDSDLVHLCERPDMPTETMRAQVMTYINEQSRDAQNSYLVYRMLLNSLTEEAQAILGLEEEKYVVDTAAESIYEGALYFKAIYAKCTVDSKAEVKVLKTKLHHLPTSINKDYVLEGSIVYRNLLTIVS
jgi:hypothetical protein